MITCFHAKYLCPSLLLRIDMQQLSDELLNVIDSYFRYRHGLGCLPAGSDGDQFYFDQSRCAIWSPTDWNAHLAHIEKIGLRTHLGLEKLHLQQTLKGKPTREPRFAVAEAPDRGYLLIPRDKKWGQGVVVLDRKGGVVWKVFNRRALIQNEVEAMRAVEKVGLSHFTPRLLHHGEIEDRYAYLVQELFPSGNHVRPEQRAQALEERISPMLFEMYRRIGLQEVDAEIYLEGLRQAYARRSPAVDLGWLFELARRVLATCPCQRVFLTRVHGDIGNSNALLVKDRIVLIDWALSREGNVFDELLRQEHRGAHLTPAFWDHLLDDPQCPDQFAKGWAQTFCIELEKLTGQPFTPSDVAFNFLGALLERIKFYVEVREYDPTPRSSASYTRTVLEYLYDRYVGGEMPQGADETVRLSQDIAVTA